MIREELLQFLWKFKLFEGIDCQTTEGKSIEILKVGTQNDNEGPDFLNASLYFEGIQWNGPIELHIHSSDWNLHTHENHPLYQNIIAHVVYEHDQEIPFFSNRNIPTIELKNRISLKTLQHYQQMKTSKHPIPCAHNVRDRVTHLPMQMYSTQWVIEKWKGALEEIDKTYHAHGNNWEATLWIRMAYGMGLKLNAEVFAQIAQQIPFSVLQKTAQKEKDLLALLHGKAGLLEEAQDEFQQEMQQRYRYISHKYQLDTQQYYPQFFRLRPAAFPTIRLALLANLYHQFPQLFGEIIRIQQAKELQAMLQSIRAIDYFQSHYVYGKNTKRATRSISKELCNALMINVLFPIRFAYDTQQGKDTSFLIDMLEELPKENNAILRRYESLGFLNTNALHSQALLALNKYYCSQKKCLLCNIGLQILKP